MRYEWWPRNNQKAMCWSRHQAIWSGNRNRSTMFACSVLCKVPAMMDQELKITRLHILVCHKIVTHLVYNSISYSYNPRVSHCDCNMALSSFIPMSIRTTSLGVTSLLCISHLDVFMGKITATDRRMMVHTLFPFLLINSEAYCLSIICSCCLFIDKISIVETRFQLTLCAASGHIIMLFTDRACRILTWLGCQPSPLPCGIFTAGGATSMCVFTQSSARMSILLNGLSNYWVTLVCVS